jgi:2-O-methyltransferase
MITRLKARGVGALAQAVLWKAKSQIPRYNAHYFLKGITGVIHVGANSGQERNLYAKHNLAVLWVEAAPTVFEELCENIKAYPTQTAANYLVTDRDDVEYVFHISNNESESSSILELHDHKKIWPNVHFERELTLKSITLDSLLGKLEMRITDFQALIMDTQGSELLVLKGATEVLRHVKFVKTEAADFESYLGCARVGDLIEYLKDYSFQLIRQDEFPQPQVDSGRYYELLFRKKA